MILRVYYGGPLASAGSRWHSGQQKAAVSLAVSLVCRAELATPLSFASRSCETNHLNGPSLLAGRSFFLKSIAAPRKSFTQRGRPKWQCARISKQLTGKSARKSLEGALQG